MAHTSRRASARTATPIDRGWFQIVWERIARPAGSSTRAVLYFVDAARPQSAPAIAARPIVRPRVAHLRPAQKAHTARNVAGTSVTPKWESRTCRNATARNAAATSATRLENSSLAAPNSTATVAMSALTDSARGMRTRSGSNEDLAMAGADRSSDRALDPEHDRIPDRRKVHEQGRPVEEMRVRSERTPSATSTITSSSGRVNGWGRPNVSPHTRRSAPPAITATRSVRVVRSDRLSAGNSLTDQNPAANSSSWATPALGRARPAFLATPLNPFVVQQRSHDCRLKSLLGVEAVAHGAVIEADRGCRRRVEQRKAMLGK